MSLLLAASGLAVWLRQRDMGTLLATEPEFTLLLRGERSGTVRHVEGRGGRASVPGGYYRLEGWRARMRDARGRTWEIERAPGEPARLITLHPHRIIPLPLATPVEPELVVEQSGRDVSFRLRFKGAGGETCGEVRVDGRRALPPALRIEDARGRTVGRLRFEDTCGAGCAQVWRPPTGLPQPLQAIPEADLGPFRLARAAFRFRLDDHPPAPEVAVGQLAPDFTLSPAGGGDPIHLSSFRGRPVVLGFFCGCGLCQAAVKRLAPEVAALGGVMLAVVENERQLQPEQVARFRTVTGFTGPILADHGGIVTRRYQSLECPRLWAVDRKGVLRYRNPNLRTPPAAMAWDILAALRVRR